MALKPSSVVAFASPLASPFDQKHPYTQEEADLSPAHNGLTPLRAHYLKRELVSLQLRKELAELSYPDALAVLGPPFAPTAVRQAKDLDLPLIRFFFHSFVLTFPMLAKAPPNFFKDKLQPFVHSFLSRNISTSEMRGQESRRDRIADKLEKHLGLIFSSSIRLTDNHGREEVVRVADRAPEASASRPSGAPNRPLPALPPGVKPLAFKINIATVRAVTTRGRIRNSTHEEFLVQTSIKGQEDVYVARRYGDFARLAEQLRKDFPEEDVRPPPPKDRRATATKAASSSPVLQPDSPNESFDYEFQQPGEPLTLSRERNRLTLRAYLRHLLNQPVIASSETLQGFLLQDPTQLSDQEKADVRLREDMDRIREAEVAKFKTEVEARVRELEVHLRAFKDDLIQKDGLTRVFATVRNTPDILDLPVEYRKLIEWARISLASTVYQLFAGSDNSSSNFQQLKRMHGLMPYFVLRGILKISNPIAMIRAFLDLFLARPFGQTSLLQRMFSTGLQDEVRELHEDMDLVAQKIGHDNMVDRVDAFVNAPKEIQDMIYADSATERLDLMTVILRSAEEPVLSPEEIQAVRRASDAYKVYCRKRDLSGDDLLAPDNDDAWLFEDLHVYLRLAQRARDKEQLIELIFEGGTSEMLKDIVTIFYQPLAQVYRAANISESLGDLQSFINDLIKTVEAAEQANVSDPQQTVQTFVDLVARHEGSFYRFVHQVHSKGSSLFDELMHWIELFINLVRDGFPQPISLEFILPHTGQEREETMKEIDAVVEYHRHLKVAHHQRMKRRMVRGSLTQMEKDQDVAFVEGVMQNLNLNQVTDDVADMAAEESGDEEGSDSSGDEFEDAQQVPDDGPGPKKPLKSKKDRVIIEPPTLKHIPKLVPVFLEMLRPSLIEARESVKATSLPATR